MAYYAALVSLVQLLEDIVHRNRFQNQLLGIQQQMALVYEKFSLLQRLLDDCSPKDREEADFLERRIRDAAYQAQDLIESHISDQNDLSERLSRLTLAPQVHTIVKGLEEAKQQVDTIVEELLTIKNSQKTEDLQLNYYSTDAATSKRAHSNADTSTMEGVEDLSMTIKDQLSGGPSRLQVVSVVGMGGIGKTTLARNIFDDKLISDRFDCRAWVTISQAYHQKKVLLDIMASLKVSTDKKASTDKSNGVGKLVEKIHKNLKGRRYLIILDDIWETKVWDDIKRALPNDSNGSRIMITTRISDVASYTGTSNFSHHMQTLNEDQSWNLFRKKVFCPLELENIGRLIANNCGGLPLAIVVVAGLLSKVNNKRSNWEEIARNVSSAAVEDDEQFSKILSLSYYHLPHHLKPLFLYMGSFLDDKEFCVFDLIMFWIAEGLILKQIESKSLEEVAEEYIDDLVKRNLVLITEKTFIGKIKRYSIHDVLRDLCRKIVCYDNFFHVLHEDSSIYPPAARDVRRIYFDRFRPTMEIAKRCGPHIRLIYHSWRENDPQISLEFEMEFRFLRILHAIGEPLHHFPTEILKLFHLRYLTLCQSALPIPPSISKLENLQTLIIHDDTFPETPPSQIWDMPPFLLRSQIWDRPPFLLPSQIWDMPNLRHIMIPRLKLALPSKDRIVDEPYILENLQTLSRILNLTFTNEFVEMIPKLRKLKVEYDEGDCGGSCLWQRFHLNYLVRLRQLKILSIRFFYFWSSITEHPFPESFAFPSSLNELSLDGCEIPWKDMMVVGSLPNLQVLELRCDSFVGEKWESMEGGFLQLRFLLMHSLEIKCWQAESTHFPSLQRLEIDDCHYLKEIPCGIGEISTLELIKVCDSKSAGESALKIQEEQRDMANDVLQVDVYQHWFYRMRDFWKLRQRTRRIQQRIRLKKLPQRTVEILYHWNFLQKDTLEIVENLYHWIFPKKATPEKKRIQEATPAKKRLQKVWRKHKRRLQKARRRYKKKL